MKKAYQDRVGTTVTATNGQLMKIIVFRTPLDIDVQFQDGTIVQHKNYQNFKKGQIKNPNIALKNASRKYIGHTNISKDGQKMIIIVYRSYHDIDVQFEDGTVVTHKAVGNFKHGRIQNPNFLPSVQRVGQVKIASNGQRMKVIRYKNANNIDVQFDDGTVVKHRAWKEFKKGYIQNPNSNKLTENRKNRVGKVAISSSGEKMKIIAYRTTSDIDVQFEDGTISKHKTFDNFVKGIVFNPNSKNSVVGMITTAKNGLRMRIISIENANNITVQFEDGTIVKKMRLYLFKQGAIPYPDSRNHLFQNFHGYRIGSKRFSLSNQVYYSTVDKNGITAILTPQMMMERVGIKPVF